MATNTIIPAEDSQTQMMILCCMCGVTIPSNPSNMCINCIRTQVDITEHLPKQLSLQFCRGCERYLQPPKFWVQCGLESRELLTLCLKKIRGLNKMKLVDAAFIWTEPHSRRVKIKVTVQKEVFNGTIVQQVFPVEYEVVNMQCEACAKSYTPHTWVAVAQIRQKVDHKRTFLFLEQLIIKHKAHENCVQIKDLPDGIDFFFMKRTHAQKFVDFVGTVAPIKTALSKRLISHDMKSNLFNYKYGLAAELAPICREDLVCLPRRSCASLGSLGPLVLCYKINAALHFIDPYTLQVGEIAGALYWKSPFRSMLTARQLSQFTVLDVELLEPQFGKFRLAEAQIVRSDEIGTNGQIFFVKTHLGNIIHPGDVVLGYDLTNTNYNEENVSRYRNAELPDVILVKRYYEKKHKPRNWKLKTLVKQEDESMRRSDINRQSEEYAKFLSELEEDEELRSAINIYRDKSVSTTAQKPAAETGDSATAEGDIDNDGSDVTEDFGIQDDELLDEDTSADERDRAAEGFDRHTDTEDDDDDDEWEVTDGDLDGKGLEEADKAIFPEDDDDDDYDEPAGKSAASKSRESKPSAKKGKAAASSSSSSASKQRRK